MASEKNADAATDVESSTQGGTQTGIVEELAIEEPTNKLQRWANKLDALAGLEARGIERISEETRERKMSLRDYIGMFTMYVSMCLGETLRPLADEMADGSR